MSIMRRDVHGRKSACVNYTCSYSHNFIYYCFGLLLLCYLGLGCGIVNGLVQAQDFGLDGGGWGGGVVSEG